MYLIILMTIVVTIAVIYGVSFLVPLTDEQGVPQKEIDDELKVTTNANTNTETVKVTVAEQDEEGEIEGTEDKPEFSANCYDKITVRDGRVFIFKSKMPLQEGSNPKRFSDLPTYRVWAERMLSEGVRCPILYYDGKPYTHPEEKYAPEVPMVTANIVNGQRRKYEAVVNYMNYGNGFTEKPFLAHTPTNVDNYEYSLYKTDNEGFRTKTDKNRKMREYSSEPSRYIGGDDLILRSQHEGLDLGMDQTLPVAGRNYRDIPEKVAQQLLESKDPYYRGAKLRRVGTSKYVVDEIQPELAEDPQDTEDILNQEFVVKKTVPIDLLAYGGTLVPAGSVHGMF